MDRREMLGTIGLGAAGMAVTAATGSANAVECGLGREMMLAGDPGWDAEKGMYVLPALPYDYAALEPAIDAETMTLHHGAHHAAYVGGLNDALAGLAAIREGRGDAKLTAPLTNKVSFNGSGHFLHSIFWGNMAAAGKGGGGEPTGQLADALKESFGSVKQAWDQFAAAAKSVEGGGWAILAWEPMSRRLLVLQTEKHQNLTAWGATPVLVLDVWEHAYYLKYRNKRGEYVDNFRTIINWTNVAERLAMAKGE